MTNSVWLPTAAAKVGQKPAKGAQILQMWGLDAEAQVYFKKEGFTERLWDNHGPELMDGCGQGSRVIMCT